MARFLFCHLVSFASLLTASYGFPGQSQKAGAAFLAIGDWGGWSNSVPVSKWQLQTADGMNKVANELGVSKVFLLGDNFYDRGVKSNTSKRFNQTFEEVFGTKEHLQDLPFHVIAGNHDYYGKVQAQMDYKGSHRWQFPSLFYVVKHSWRRADGGTATVDIIFTDSQMLAPDSKLSPKRFRHTGIDVEKWAWVEQQMEASTADFLIVAGHYPIYASGGEGPVKEMVQKMLPLLKAHGAHYISGHDHILGHYEEEGVHMFVTGIGRMCCYPSKYAKKVPKEVERFYITGDKAKGPGVGTRLVSSPIVGGFLAIELFDDFVRFSFYTETGALLYQPTAIPKRDQARRLLGDSNIVT
mmetsp:Transcript_71635/g.155895  ORF Transcript_71635/g.155895 Transcript_71635/m.155895 type:complete len:354 (+) Transcript_71635:60-1121(+)